MQALKKALLTAILLLAGSVLLTGQSVKEFSQTLPFEPGETLSLKAFKGSIHLTSWESNQVEVVATIEAPGYVSAEYAQQTVEATRIEMRRTGSGVSIKSDYDQVPFDRSRWFGYSKILPYVHYQIRLPRSLRLRLNDYKSDIEVYGLEGDLRINTYKGNLEGRGLAGELTLETYKGVARLSAVQGSVNVETYKGNVDIEVDALEADSRLDTYKGDITLHLPASQSATIRADLNKRSGFKSGFDLERRYRSKYSFDAELNGGGPRILVKTYKGDIRLER